MRILDSFGLFFNSLLFAGLQVLCKSEEFPFVFRRKNVVGGSRFPFFIFPFFFFAVIYIFFVFSWRCGYLVGSSEE